MLMKEIEPTVIVPQTQSVWSSNTAIAVKTGKNPSGLVDAIRREVLAIDREQPIDHVATLEQMLSDSAAAPRFRTQLLGAFSALALVLSLIGIYGVNSYAISQRRHEIGIRMALGARPADVLRHTLGQGVRLTILGILIGLGGALALSQILVSLLYEVSATDPLIFAAVSLILAAVSLAASYVPALRATRIDPVVALRQE